MQRTIAKLSGATLQFGAHALWKNLSLEIKAGEFLAVLGPNGSGKSSLLKVLLGINMLTSGDVSIEGAAPRQARASLGYIPQQKAFDADLPLRGIDLVRLGVDGTRFGFGTSADAEQKVARAIREVGATKFASRPLGKLSGGEQQRLRIAQALVHKPQLLLCDEPLLSLDLASQQNVSSLINERRKNGAAVIFVTHEVNPILPYVDRILYLANGKWALGTPSEVLTSSSLTRLYGSPVEVAKVGGRIVVVGGDPLATEPVAGHKHHLTDMAGES